MSLSQEVEVLKRIPLFANVEPSKLKLLAFTSERMRFAAGETLFEQDEAGDAAHIVIEGQAEVTIRGQNGPVRLAILGPNDFVGEMALLGDMPRTATVRALTDLVTLMISRDLFFRLLNEFPQMSIAIMRALALRLEKTNRQAAGLPTDTPSANTDQ